MIKLLVVSQGMMSRTVGDFLGNDYTGEYITAWNHCGVPDKQKQGLYLGLDIVAQTAELLYVDIYIDGEVVPHRTVTVNLDVGGDLWNYSNWDEAKFASDTFLTSVVSLNQINFRQISVGFRTDIKDAPWQLLQARLRYTILPTAGTRR